jgi:uncharacterized protein (TIGR03435 family)
MMRATFVRYKTRLASAGVFAAFVGAILIGFVSAAPSHAQSAAQNGAAAAPVFEYEVATIKTYKPGKDEGPGVMRVGIMNAPDGFSASGATLQMLIQQAYGVQSFQIIGAPDWSNSDRFEIDAKMDASVADALKKMSNDERAQMRQKMLQGLLADRFKLAIHRDTKELPAYTLMIGKNGSKVVEAKPSDAAPGSAPAPGRGGPGRGGLSVNAGAGGVTVTANASPMTSLVRTISNFMRAPVIDKTGMTGSYDFALTFMPDNFGGGALGIATPSHDGAPSGAMPGDPGADATGPTLIVALEEQLGLKLEKGKGQAEIIVIDHVEKASDN